MKIIKTLFVIALILYIGKMDMEDKKLTREALKSDTLFTYNR
jgi:hypothetical protein